VKTLIQSANVFALFNYADPTGLTSSLVGQNTLVSVKHHNMPLRLLHISRRAVGLCLLDWNFLLIFSNTQHN